MNHEKRKNGNDALSRSSCMLGACCSISCTARYIGNLDKLVDIHGLTSNLGELIHGQDDTPPFTITSGEAAHETPSREVRNRQNLLFLIGLAYRGKSGKVAEYLSLPNQSHSVSYKYAILDLPLQIDTAHGLGAFLNTVSSEEDKLNMLGSLLSPVRRCRKIQNAQIRDSVHLQQLQALNFLVEADFVEIEAPVNFFVSIKEYVLKANSPELSPATLLKISNIKISADLMDRIEAIKPRFMESPESQRGKFPRIVMSSYSLNETSYEQVARTVDLIGKLSVYTSSAFNAPVIFKSVQELAYAGNVDFSNISFQSLNTLKVFNASLVGYRSLNTLQATVDTLIFGSNYFKITSVPSNIQFNRLHFDPYSSFSMEAIVHVNHLTISAYVPEPDLKNFRVRESLVINRDLLYHSLGHYKLFMTGERVKIYLASADLIHVGYESTVKHVEIDQSSSPRGVIEHFFCLPDHIRRVTISSLLIRDHKELVDILFKKLDTIEIFMDKADRESIMTMEREGFIRTVKQKKGNIIVTLRRY
jgi:hypothetical protein